MSTPTTPTPSPYYITQPGSYQPAHPRMPSTPTTITTPTTPRTPAAYGGPISEGTGGGGGGVSRSGNRFVTPYASPASPGPAYGGPGAGPDPGSSVSRGGANINQPPPLPRTPDEIYEDARSEFGALWSRNVSPVPSRPGSEYGGATETGSAGRRRSDLGHGHGHGHGHGALTGIGVVRRTPLVNRGGVGGGGRRKEESREDRGGSGGGRVGGGVMDVLQSAWKALSGWGGDGGGRGGRGLGTRTGTGVSASGTSTSRLTRSGSGHGFSGMRDREEVDAPAAEW